MTPQRETASEGSVVELVREVLRDAATLLRQHAALLRAELGEKASHAVRSLVLIAIGAVAALCGVIFLLLSLSLAVTLGLAAVGLDHGAASVLGPLVVGGVVLAGAGLLVSRGARGLSQGSLAPERTMKALEEDREWLEELFARRKDVPDEPGAGS